MSCVQWIVRDLKGTGLGNQWQGNLEKKRVERHVWVGIKYWDICIPCECSLKKRILIIKWIGWPIMWIPISLFPANPAIAQWAHKKRGHAGRGGDYAWSSIHQNQLEYSQFCVPDLPAPETNTVTLISYHYSRWSASYLWQMDYIGLFSLWKGQQFVLTMRSSLDEINIKTSRMDKTDCPPQ